MTKSSLFRIPDDDRILVESWNIKMLIFATVVLYFKQKTRPPVRLLQLTD
jgi:hypothetical protein